MLLKDQIKEVGLKQKFIAKKFNTNEAVVSTLLNNEELFYKMVSYVEEMTERGQA